MTFAQVEIKCPVCGIVVMHSFDVDSIDCGADMEIAKGEPCFDCEVMAIEASIERSQKCSRCGQFFSDRLPELGTTGMCEDCIAEVDLISDEDYMQR